MLVQRKIFNVQNYLSRNLHPSSRRRPPCRPSSTRCWTSSKRTSTIPQEVRRDLYFHSRKTSLSQLPMLTIPAAMPVAATQAPPAAPAEGFHGFHSSTDSPPDPTPERPATAATAAASQPAAAADDSSSPPAKPLTPRTSERKRKATGKLPGVTKGDVYTLA